MPTLNWIGKEKVVNHHLDVPFRTLEKKYTFASEGQDDGGNMIIHGDNLDALKALLPKYEGRVKCIYIEIIMQTTLRHGSQAPFECLCGNSILSAACCPCLFFLRNLLYLISTLVTTFLRLLQWSVYIIEALSGAQVFVPFFS